MVQILNQWYRDIQFGGAADVGIPELSQAGPENLKTLFRGEGPTARQAARLVVFETQGLGHAEELSQQAHVEQPWPISGKLARAVQFQTTDLPRHRQAENTAVGYPPLQPSGEHQVAAFCRVGDTFQFAEYPVLFAAIGVRQVNIREADNSFRIAIQRGSQSLNIGGAMMSSWKANNA